MHSVFKFRYLALSLLLIAAYFFGCPFVKFFGITCPACGVSHAWLSFINGDLAAAFKFNPVFIPLTACFLRIVYCDIMSKKQGRAEIICYLLVAAAAFSFNLVRIFSSCL